MTRSFNNLCWLGFLVLAGHSLPVKLVAQESVELPKVTFSEPPVREFDINDSLLLHIKTDVPFNKLQARVFWGTKAGLIDRAKSAPAKSCVYYPSFVVPFQSSNGGVRFGWQFQPYFLKQVSDDRFDNQVYTVVLEKRATQVVKEFRLYPKDVELYFQSGQEIVVIAPPGLQAGARAVVARVKEIKAIEVQQASKGGPGTPTAPRAECIVVKTRHVATANLIEVLVKSCGELR